MNKPFVEKLYNNSSNNRTFQGFDLTIRPMKVEDLDIFMKWRNDPRILQFMIPDMKVNKISLRLWFNNVIKNNKSLLFIIYCDGKKNGFLELTNFNFEDKICQHNILLDPNALDKGIGIRTLLLQEKILFFMDIETLFLRIRLQNKRNLHIWDKLGATITGHDENIQYLLSHRKERQRSLRKYAQERGYQREWEILSHEIKSEDSF